MSEVENVQIEGEATQQIAESVAEPTAEIAPEDTVVEEAAVEEATDSAPPTEVAGLDAFMSKLGEIPEEANEQLLSQIDDKTFDRMSDSAKGVLKHLIAKQNADYDKRVKAFEAQQQGMSSREEKLRDEAKSLIRNRAELNRVLLDPKFQEFMKAADIAEEDMEDPFSEKGLNQRISKGVVSAMREFQTPIREAAEKAQRMASYQDFIDRHPEMKDPGFKKEVRQMMTSRREAGNPVSLDDAFNLVDRQRMLAVKQAREEKERTARAKSARRVARATNSSKSDGGDPVPKWVTKNGYKGARGNVARIRYLQDNPKALERLRQQQKAGR